VRFVACGHQDSWQDYKVSAITRTQWRADKADIDAVGAGHAGVTHFEMAKAACWPAKTCMWKSRWQLRTPGSEIGGHRVRERRA